MDFMIAGYPMSLPDYDDYTNSKYLSNILDIIEFPNNNQNEALQLNIGSNVGDNTDGDASGNTNEIFQTLWIGNKLSDMEIISLNSFVKNGLQIHLYCYQAIENVPKGVVIKDARDILSENEIFTYKNGSYSAFSNLFRFTMLNKIGGIADTDFVCLKPFNFSHKDRVIVSEPSEEYSRQYVTSCMIKLPKNSPESLFGINIQKNTKN